MPLVVCRLLALAIEHSNFAKGIWHAVGVDPAVSKLLLSSAAVPSILFMEVPIAMQDSSMEAAGCGKSLPACAKELPRLQLPSLADLANGPGSIGTPPTGRPLRQRKISSEEHCLDRLRGARKRQALPLRLQQAYPDEICSTSITALPTDLMVQIFGHLDAKALRRVLPMVCRQWHELLERPLTLWNHVDIDFAEETRMCIQNRSNVSLPIVAASTSLPLVRHERVATWLQSRAAAVRSLRLRVSGSSQELRAADESELGPEPVFDISCMHNFGRYGLASVLHAVVNSLEELFVEKCYDLITTAALRAMGGCKKLKVLSLKGIRSALDIDDFAAIAALRQLEELVLDCDQPPELGGVDEIKWGLPEFPEGVLHLVNITHLTLSCHYGITELPPGITSLNKLEVLDLDFCTLAALPPVLGQLTCLTTLDVEGNLYLGDAFRGATTPAAGPLLPSPQPFPADLASLQALRFLNLNSCGLNSLPAVLSTLHNLETLDLENNDLQSLSLPGWENVSSMGYLTRLQCLNLANCKLEAVPGVVENLASLCILDLTNNQIQDDGLPLSLSRLPRLRAIGLKENCLTRVPRVLGYVNSLQEIYLEENTELEVVAPLDFLLELPNLRVLMMGKLEGTWSPQSMAYINDFTKKQLRRNPERDVLLISCPDNILGSLVA